MADTKLITAIVLTFNEELHITRCVKNLLDLAEKVYVIDSFSTDKTVELAQEAGAHVMQHKFVNQAQQFHWALDNCPVETEWVMRLDADEYLTAGLIQEIANKLPLLDTGVNGVYLKRNVKFLGKVMRFGSLKPVTLLRVWRKGTAFMEQRWMDEQIVLKEGEAVTFDNRFLDDNLNGLTEWTKKHNGYSNREIVTQLDKRYHLFESGEDESLSGRNSQKGLYYRMPRFLRALAYFTFRYIVCLGFLDGLRGLIWLTLQSYWYRFLVDAKLYEMEKSLGKNPSREQVIQYVRRFFKINIPE